jgi:galactonate dehydratase
MKITAIKSFAYEGPVSDLCFVKVETDKAGLYGWGEASLPMRCPAVAQAVLDIAPLVIGMDPFSIEACWQRMYRHSYWRGGPILTSSISGIDTALWDIKGKVIGEPVFRLLGGPVREKAMAYANLGLSTDPNVLVERATEAMKLGYRAFKFYPLPSVGAHETPATIKQIKDCCIAVREVIGPERLFGLDFHGRCSKALAIQIEAAVRDTFPMWIEEPVQSENTANLKRCSDQFKTPIAAGERLFTRWGFKDLLASQWVDVIQPDVSNAGGISEMMKIGSMAEVHGVAIAPHNPNGPVQMMASLHLAFALPSFSILEHRHDVDSAFATFATTYPSIMSDGNFDLPHLPGLGIDLDEKHLLKHPGKASIFESYRTDGSVADW